MYAKYAEIIKRGKNIRPGLSWAKLNFFNIFNIILKIWTKVFRRSLWFILFSENYDQLENFRWNINCKILSLLPNKTSKLILRKCSLTLIIQLYLLRRRAEFKERFPDGSQRDSHHHRNIWTLVLLNRKVRRECNGSEKICWFSEYTWCGRIS